MIRLTYTLLACAFLTVSSAKATESSVLMSIAYTYQRASGNRTVDGSGAFPDVSVDSLPGYAFSQDRPAWLLGVQNDAGVTWQVAAADSATPIPTGIPDLSFPDASPASAPVPIGDAWVYIAANGDLVLWRDGVERDRHAADAMLDSRIVVNEQGQAAVYVEPTDRYPHGVMGDTLEAAALIVFTAENDTLTVTARVQLPARDVFEGLIPMWADIDGDGNPDVVTTVSNSAVGARLVVYRADGTLLAETPPVGRGNRWRHQIAFAPFGPDGTMELAEVQTPHLGGIVQFWHYDADLGTLVLSAAGNGRTSHIYGSPNLDQALAGDFDGDGIPELVLTDQGRRRVTGLQRRDGVIREVWSFNLPAAPVTNFAAVNTPDGLMLAIGLADGTLRIWGP